MQRQSRVLVFHHRFGEGGAHGHVVVAYDLFALRFEHVADDARSGEQIHDRVEVESGCHVP